MRTILILSAFLINCASLSGLGLVTQDCVTTHIKALNRDGQPVDTKLYERIVDACKEIHAGRP